MSEEPIDAQAEDQVENQVFNAADEKQVKKRKRKEEKDEEARRRDKEVVLSTPEGRRFIWDHLAACGVFAPSFSTDPGRTAFNEGRRDIGLRLLREITDHFPDAYLLMQSEAYQAAKKEKANG